jgi:hypothetical protein
MPNIQENLEEQLKELNINFTLFDDYMEVASSNNATEISIVDTSDGFLDIKNFKLPKKKLVDFDWVMGKINTDKVYQSFTENFKKLLTIKGYQNSINVYPTSYGIGIFVMYQFRSEINRLKEDVNSLLDEYGIEYSSEYSDAGWVFRYKISKKKENIEKLNNI